MLSQDNIDRINNQIESEIDKLDSIFTSTGDKPAIIARIAALKAVLEPQPTREQLIAEIAEAVIEKLKSTQPPTLMDLFESFARH